MVHLPEHCTTSIQHCGRYWAQPIENAQEAELMVAKYHVPTFSLNSLQHFVPEKWAIVAAGTTKIKTMTLS
jgi:hypothetical protein